MTQTYRYDKQWYWAAIGASLFAVGAGAVASYAWGKGDVGGTAFAGLIAGVFLVGVIVTIAQAAVCSAVVYLDRVEIRSLRGLRVIPNDEMLSVCNYPAGSGWSAAYQGPEEMQSLRYSYYLFTRSHGRIKLDPYYGDFDSFYDELERRSVAGRPANRDSPETDA